MRQNNLVEAKQDFTKAIEIDNRKFSGYIGLGDVYRAYRDFKQAIKNYSIVIEQEEHLMEIIGLKRVICYMELKNYKSAQEDIEKILKINSKNSEALYFSGLIARAAKDLKKAVLILEEVVNANNNETITLKALHEIALIRIEERDIYQAYYTLDRLESIPKSIGYLYKAKQFLEGAISIMKKKYKEGLNYLDELVSDEELHEQLRPLVLSYRAYGNFSEGNIEKALADYEFLREWNQSLEGDDYNMELCQGVLVAQKKNWEEAKKHFEKAKRMSPAKIEPKFYLAVRSSI